VVKRITFFCGWSGWRNGWKMKRWRALANFRFKFSFRIFMLGHVWTNRIRRSCWNVILFRCITPFFRGWSGWSGWRIRWRNFRYWNIILFRFTSFFRGWRGWCVWRNMIRPLVNFSILSFLFPLYCSQSNYQYIASPHYLNYLDILIEENEENEFFLINSVFKKNFLRSKKNQSQPFGSK